MENLIVEYNSKWKILFEEEKVKLGNLLGSDAVAIEHIGSTAVEGLCALPVIDVAVAVKKSTPINELISKLEEIGYSLVTNVATCNNQEGSTYKQGDLSYPSSTVAVAQAANHYYEKTQSDSEAVALALEYFVLLRSREDEVVYCLFLILIGRGISITWLFFIATRDYLKDHPDVAAYYSNFKRTIAKTGLDNYEKEKAVFLARIVKQGFKYHQDQMDSFKEGFSRIGENIKPDLARLIGAVESEVLFEKSKSWRLLTAILTSLGIMLLIYGVIKWSKLTPAWFYYIGSVFMLAVVVIKRRTLTIWERVFYIRNTIDINSADEVSLFVKEVDNLRNAVILSFSASILMLMVAITPALFSWGSIDWIGQFIIPKILLLNEKRTRFISWLLTFLVQGALAKALGNYIFFRLRKWWRRKHRSEGE